MRPDQTHKETYEQGLRLRRAVLGDAHVNRSMSHASDFTRPIQELLTEFAWGKIWSRSGLSHKTRSLLNLAILTALNRPHELEVHLRGALTNGASTTEIQEVLLQSAIYAGIPAALDAFRIAEKVITDTSPDHR